MENNLVSIIMPTYGCGKFIGRSIESVLAQTYGEWELLVQDDCSVDETETVVAEFARGDARIKYEKNERNSGAAVTRNRALQRARGRWIAFLDSDDLWLPEKLERQLRFMSENGYAFSYHEYEEISEAGEPLGIRVSGKRRVSKWEMFACCWPGCLAVMYDASVVGLVQIADIRKNNDTAMWLKVVRKAPCYLLPESLAFYQRRSGSITPKPLWARIWAHYPLFRIAEGMNPVAATFWTFVTVAGHAVKKMFYISKY